MTVARHILMAFSLVLLLASCSGRPRIIPRSTLEDIYIDMFIADQWLADHPSERQRVDTMLFYDPIFKRYGYTFEDYDATIKRYLKDPEKFHRIFRDANVRLRVMRDNYRKKADELEKIREYNSQFRGYSYKNFDEDDTVLWKPVSKDSLDSLASRADTLLRDTLVRDTLAMDSPEDDTTVPDMLPLKQLIVRDSLKLIRHTPDSVRKERADIQSRKKVMQRKLLITD